MRGRGWSLFAAMAALWFVQLGFTFLVGLASALVPALDGEAFGLAMALVGDVLSLTLNIAAFLYYLEARRKEEKRLEQAVEDQPIEKPTPIVEL
jgi:hypothetical protein